MPDKQLHILIVEDHPDTRLVLSMFLNMLGHCPEAVPDAGRALERAAQKLFDVLLTDIWLPNKGGWNLLSELRTRGDLPLCVISMSAGDEYEMLPLSKAAKCAAHLVKPFKAEELEAILLRAA